MNNDLISRSELKKAIMNDLGLGDDENGSDAEYMSGLQDCYNLIDNAPTVDIESVKSELNPTVTCWYDFDRGYEKGYERGKNERPQGEWIKWNFKTFGAMGDWEYKCSNCEKVYGGEYNFCPNCGADMRVKGEEE